MYSASNTGPLNFMIKKCYDNAILACKFNLNSSLIRKKVDISLQTTTNNGWLFCFIGRRCLAHVAEDRCVCRNALRTVALRPSLGEAL